MPTAASRRPGAAARVGIGAVGWYRRWISPVRPPTCRFDPTCSAYAVDALQRRGAVVGLWLAVVRLLKCGPWHPGGYDPVPVRAGDRTPPRSVDAVGGSNDVADELRSE